MAAFVFYNQKVPGSSQVKVNNQSKGLDVFFTDVGLFMPMTPPGNSSSQTRTTGLPSFTTFDLYFQLDGAYAKFLQFCCSGETLGDSVINLVTSAAGAYQLAGAWTLTDTLVQSVEQLPALPDNFAASLAAIGTSTQGQTASQLPVPGIPFIKVSLNHSSLQFEYTASDATNARQGTIASGKLSANNIGAK